jgi:hypothetical protein
MRTTTTTGKPDLLVIFRRYDKPDVLYTIHRLTYTHDYLRDLGFFADGEDHGYTYDQPMEVFTATEAGILEEDYLADRGYRPVRIDWTDPDPELLRIVSQCGPIQAHRDLAAGRSSVTTRVKVLAKHEGA